MNSRWIVDRVKNLIAQPAKEWKAIAEDNNDFNFHIKSFALPLIVALSVATLLNLLLFHKGFSMKDALLFAIIDFASNFLGMYFSSLIITFIAPTFSAVNDKVAAFKYIIYSSTPMYIAMLVTNLFPSLFFLNLFFLYTIYLLWLGSDILLKTPENNKLGFIIISVIILFGAGAAIHRILVEILPVETPIVG
jgi:uncharacterized membrane protein YciS (DUF1049 family)